MVKFEPKLTKTDIQMLVREEIQASVMPTLDIIQNNMKLREKTLFSALESFQTSMNLTQKEFNLKIGSLKGHETKREKSKDDDVLVEFDSPEQFQMWLDAQKKKFMPESVPHVDTVSTFVDKDMLNDLLDK